MPAKNPNRRPPAGDSATLADDIRIGLLGPIPALLRELRCDPAKVLAGTGFDPAIFEKPDARVSYLQAAHMLVVCAKASRTPHFGLLVGQRFELPMLGPLEPLLRNAATVRETLTQLVRHLHLHDRGAVIFLAEREQGEIAVGYNVFDSTVPGAMHIYGIVLTSICVLLQALCGPSWQPLRIMFAHDMPADLDPYHQLYRAPLHFNAAHTEVVFDSHWLDQPLRGTDTRQRINAERNALATERQNDSHFVSRVRRIIYELLMIGEVSAQLISERLGVHERVLRRHLHAEGVSIKQLTGSARHEIACQLLGNTQLSLAEIATALAYSDATAFSRAFRQWQGMPPDSWRRQAREKPTGRSSSTVRKPIDRTPG